MEKEQLKIEYVSLDEIKPNEYNPKKMTEKEEKDLEKSITEFGIVDPLIVNKAKGRKGIIIGGHQRYKIYKKLNYKKVPVVWIDVPDIEKEKELCLRLSKNTGSFDFDLLINFDEGLLKETGFEDEELDEIFGLEIDDDFDVEKEFDKFDITVENPRGVKEGDLWQMGEHRLYIGDSTKKESWEKLLHKENVRMVFSDPPYAIYGSSTGVNVDNKMIYPFFRAMWQIIDEILPSDVYICCDWRSYPVVQATMNRFEVKDIIVWDKMSGGLGCPYRRRHEFILFAKPRRQQLRMMTKKMKYYGKKITDDDVWQIKREKEFIGSQKPIELCQRAIKNSSEKGEIVIDCFAGSGSTLIACEIMKRKARCIEIDPLYGEVIINRWEKFTGKQPKKLN